MFSFLLIIACYFKKAGCWKNSKAWCNSMFA